MIVNGLVAQRGDTIIIYGLWLPLLGHTDVSAEALAEGGVLALRILVVLMAFAVHAACVDPDRVLRLLRPLARRSALTATLIARLVPLAAADHARLGEAAALRGPAAAPVGRAAMARRLVAGSLDRAVDVAATLELRGYARGAPGSARRGPPARYAGRFLAAGIVIAAIAARRAHRRRRRLRLLSDCEHRPRRGHARPCRGHTRARRASVRDRAPGLEAPWLSRW